jgi:cytochrome bd-type quinol oxidase subunit 2
MDQLLKSSQLIAYVSLGQIRGFSKGFFKTAPTQPQTRFASIISSVITVFTLFAGLAFLFWFLTGALTWITSSGQPEQLNKAKNQMSTAFVCLFIIVISYSIISILGKVTGLDILNPELIINKLRP